MWSNESMKNNEVMWNEEMSGKWRNENDSNEEEI